MDTLPLGLTAICQRLDHIEVTRIINASTRRLPFQIKIGAGLTVEEFRARIAGGRMGHVGLAESIGMVFHTLGKTLARQTSTIEPIVANTPITGKGLEVQPGQVRGLRQVARAHTPEGEFMVLIFVAALEQDNEGDTIKIAGKPDLEVKLSGTNGDVATVAIAVNAVRRVREASPGLVTMADIPLITHR
jgi:4-hydroxy-tetrahydrodipicolinate reductase